MSFSFPDGFTAVACPARRLAAALETTPNGVIGHICFNFPDKHNVIDLEGWQAISPLMAAFDEVDNIRVIVLRGVGGRAFVAGADIAQFDEVLSGPEGTDFDRATVSAFDAIAACPIPTLAAIEGYCIGGGLGIAAACDIRISRDDGRFGVPAGKLGLAYPANATRHLAQLVGPAEAKRILFTADPLDSETALRIGLVQEIFDADSFDDGLAAILAQITANAPLSLQTSKYILDNPHADAAAVKKRLADCLASADYEEGRTAFMQKRKPVFKGK